MSQAPGRAAGRITLESPIPQGDLPALWRILNEFPLANFDDGAPTALAPFAKEMAGRLERGELSWAVYQDGVMIGGVGYAPMTFRTGMLHGICFSKDVHGTGVAAEAMRRVLGDLIASGVEKISASFFIDNQRVRSFLRKLGAVDEGVLRAQTIRGGRTVDMRLVAFHVWPRKGK